MDTDPSAAVALPGQDVHDVDASATEYELFVQVTHSRGVGCGANWPATHSTSLVCDAQA
jgi:hypothetical protein